MGNLLKDQVAIITGSGQGIGKDLAVWMASQGCKVITNNRKKGSSMQAHDGKVVKLNEADEAKLSTIIGDAETAAAAVNTASVTFASVAFSVSAFFASAAFLAFDAFFAAACFVTAVAAAVPFVRSTPASAFLMQTVPFSSVIVRVS